MYKYYFFILLDYYTVGEDRLVVPPHVLVY
jgi:hypothetical protein